MVKKVAVIILAHKNAEYINYICKIYNDINFYVHADLKQKKFFNDLLNAKKNNNNLFLVTERYDVNWGGNSLVKATLSALKQSLLCEKNFYFHVMSSECLPVKSFELMVREWKEKYHNGILMECISHSRQCWRLRREAPHADTPLQRVLLGKLITKAIRYLPFLFSKAKIDKDEYLFGSQWLSIQRPELEKIIAASTDSVIKEFDKILCSDEHFFQIMAKRVGLEKKITNYNLRYVHWLNARNSPNYLSYDDISNIAKKNECWFVRKVNQDVSIKYLRNSHE
ncbi:beta-1,6-N-acetylglucosaminyltransferase [Mixta intestinalis]|uniref:Peptide O-xylosyltransferase n=1 Tax=Mixta intestinalis TaxID=1615494 RepID=A0A6P1PZU1_9GAMM|nr:beta-1,6-N-acetylglucosaminyltransferase [Mixta intestinalis]QHM71582.1 hypothetical protein C7M51_01873 [Mixta intestinalis]